MGTRKTPKQAGKNSTNEKKKKKGIRIFHLFSIGSPRSNLQSPRLEIEGFFNQIVRPFIVFSEY